jgi:hypothetical protein
LVVILLTYLILFFMKAKSLFFFFSFMILAISLQAQITGTVFRDFNANGVKETNESLLSGVVVNAYNAANTLCGTTTTTSASAPNYSLSGCGTGAVRVEFIIPSSGGCTLNNLIDFTSGGGSSYGSSVQFASGNSSNINFAVNAPEDYFLPSESPKLYVPCYINGDPANANVAAADAFVGVNYNATSPTQYVATVGQIGSTWGVAFSKQAQKIFTSAILKRHVGLGPLGSGGIYMMDPVTNTVTNWLDLDVIGIATRGAGTYTGPGPLGPVIPFSPVIGTNDERDLGNGLNQPSHDAPAFAQIGKLSLGDIDISDDGRYLFVMNLYDKRVYRIDLVNPSNPEAPTLANVSSRVTSWLVPNPGCVNGEHRPYALEFARGNLFVGLVCSGETGGSNADMDAYVYQVTNFSAGTYSTLFSIPLDYDKGYAFTHFGNIPDAEATKGWFPWTDDASFTANFYGDSYPQPILSDIVFDTDGSLILGFMDRFGHQGGFNNYNPHNTQLMVTIIGGDILRAYFDPTTCSYELENNAKEGVASPKAATAGAGNGQGPGGGEFYFDECFDCNTAGFHQETVMGGLSMALGSGEVAVSVIDPLALDSGGLSWYSNITGADTKRYELYNVGNNGGISSDGTFSKANGLGDLEVSGSPAPIEIGNRVWLDTDSDGIQDADEAPISGVTVELVKNGTVIATATTDANGNYYFSSGTGTNTSSAIYGIAMLMPDMAYIVRIPNVQGGSKQAALGVNSLTTANADGTTNGDYRDSDGILIGNNAEVTVTTSSIPTAGANNHTFDFGFNPAPLCTVSISCTPTSVTSCTPLNGAVSTMVTGGQGSISYLWSNGTTTSALSGLATGTYTVTVSDDFAVGCTNTCSATVATTTTLPTASCAKVDNTNCATPNGSATVTTNGNQISWSTGATTASITGLSNGTYTVTVTNTTTGCTNTCSATVATTTTLPTASCTAVDNTNCATPNGSATVVTNANQILWSTGGTTASISGLSNGTYTVTVTNTTSGCTNTCQAVVANGSVNPTCSISATSQPTCTNLNGGAISVTPSPAGTYNYAWSDSGPATASRSGLTGGTYTVTVTNTTTNCTGVCNVTLTTPTNCCNINAIVPQNLECLDNGTPALITDNRIRFSAMVTNTNTSLTGYNVTINGGTTITPNTNVPYGITQFTLGAGTAGGGATFTIIVTDSATPGCTQTFQVIDPGTCTPATPECPPVKCGTATIQVNGN